MRPSAYKLLARSQAHTHSGAHTRALAQPRLKLSVFQRLNYYDDDVGGDHDDDDGADYDDDHEDGGDDGGDDEGNYVDDVVDDGYDGDVVDDDAAYMTNTPMQHTDPHTHHAYSAATHPNTGAQRHAVTEEPTHNTVIIKHHAH